MAIAELSEIGDNGAPLLAAYDWLAAENARPESPFYQKPDLQRAVLGGHSIGSVKAFLVAPDPRWMTSIHVAGGSLDNVRDPRAPTTGKGGKALVRPAALICSESDTFGNVEKTQEDYDQASAPVFFTMMKGTEHVGAAREALPAIVAWPRDAPALLQDRFQVYAVDLRGQGRTTWTPRRYRQSLRQAVRPTFEPLSKHLGDQWSIGDWQGLQVTAMADPRTIVRLALRRTPEPSQSLREYEPEWARAFVEGTVAQSCPHETMLAGVRVPVLLTHHSRAIDPATGNLLGALSDLQATKAQQLLAAAGVPFAYQSYPDAAHPTHNADPARFAGLLSTWANGLPA